MIDFVQVWLESNAVLLLRDVTIEWEFQAIVGMDETTDNKVTALMHHVVFFGELRKEQYDELLAEARKQMKKFEEQPEAHYK